MFNSLVPSYYETEFLSILILQDTNGDVITIKMEYL